MIDLFPSRTVAIDIFGFGVHWYGLLYFAAFVLAWYLLPRLQRFRELELTGDQWSTILSWAVAGVIIGGRLGYVLFYNPVYYITHPLEIFAVWNGGMSSHGGFVGVASALWWVLRDRKSDFWRIADVVVIPVAIGLAFGRVGNFINQELYGTVTSLPWGMQFPGADGLRHPVQLYSVAKDLCIAAACFLHLRRQPYVAGRTAGLFLMLYGVLRFLVEFVREQNGVFIGPFSEGQLLTIPVLAAGVWVWMRKINN